MAIRLEEVESWHPVHFAQLPDQVEGHHRAVFQFSYSRFSQANGAMLFGTGIEL